MPLYNCSQVVTNLCTPACNAAFFLVECRNLAWALKVGRSLIPFWFTVDAWQACLDSCCRCMRI